MVPNYVDQISRFGQVGAYPTPNAMGASNPVASYLQSYSNNSLPDMAGNSIGGLGSGAFPPAPGSNFGGGDNKYNTPLGANLGTANLALGGLQAIGNIWAAWEANRLAKKQFAFQKNMAETNLANQIQAYNTTLEDRIRARTHTEGGTQAEADAYLQKNRLTRQNG